VELDMMEESFPDWHLPAGRPRSLSLAEAVRMTLKRLRRNVTFAGLGEDFGLAGSVRGEVCLVERDVSDGVQLAPPQGPVLRQALPVRDERAGCRGPARPGDRRQQGLSGKLARHARFTDVGLTCLAEAAGTAIGDSGYQGSDMITPDKKQPGQDRTESGLEHNTAIAVIRAAVEWASAHLKNWRILATRYRDSLTRFDRTIATIAGLVMLSEEHSGRRLTFTRDSTN
jgi:DDE superfamily endonuclease